MQLVSSAEHTHTHTQTDTLKSVENQAISVCTDVHCIFVHTMEVNGNQISLVLNILQNIFSLFHRREKNHTYLK